MCHPWMPQVLWFDVGAIALVMWPHVNSLLVGKYVYACGCLSVTCEVAVINTNALKIIYLRARLW